LTGRVVERERVRLADAQKRLQERVTSISSREGRLRIQADIDALAERRRIIDRQRLLPTSSPLFWGLLTANLALLLFAPSIAGNDAVAQPLRVINEILCAACGNRANAS
jgi:hypothetical protein